MGKHHGKGGKSGLGKTLGIVGFAAGFAFPGAFLGAAAGTAGAVRLSAALMGLSLGTTIGSAFAKQSQDMPASNFDNKMNVVDQNAMIPVVYGTRKIGGLQSYHSASVKHKTLTKDVILGEGQFSGCYGITANGYSVNSNVSGAVFGITNTNNANAYVRVHDGKLEFDTNGASVGVYNRVSGWFAPWYRRWLEQQVQKNGGYRKIDLQSSDDINDNESNDFQCYIAKMYQYIEGIRYDNDLAALGWKLVNPIVVDDAPNHLNNTDWVNVGNGKTAWFSMNHDETKDSYITFYDGTQGAPSYYMKTGAYPNMSYLHAYLKYTEKLGSGNPTVTCIAKGRKVYDTRTNQWGYSENPAMIIRDYLINTTFGSGRYINQSMIDEDSFKDAANYCDAKVTSFDTQGRSITEPRYRLNIVINSKRSYLENLQSMLACCAGYLVFTKGQVAMRIERADNPVYAFDDDNIIQNSMSYSAASSTESPNKLNMKYIEPTLDWTSVSAIVEDLADQKQQPVGRGKIVEKDVELIGVTSQCQALRLGKIYRDLIRLCPISVEFKTAMQALNLEPGDVVTLSHNVVLEDNNVQPLFSKMPVRITEIRDDSGIYTIKAQQYNASIYDDRMGGNLKDYDYTTIKKPEDLLSKAVPNVENLKAYTIYKQGRDGVANYDLVVTYDLPNGYLLEAGMVYYKCNEGYDLSTLGVIPEGVTGTEVGFANDWKFAGEAPSRLVIPNVHIGVTYKLLVQARNKSGNKAPMVDCPTVTITVEKKTTIPNKPANLSIKYTDVATVSWEDVTNSDIDYYEIRTNKDVGENDGLLARTSDTSVVVPLASRTGTIYVFGHNTSKLYGYPAILEYSKALPPKPNAPTVVSKLGALGITTDAIPSDCSGVKIHINHDVVTSTNNTVQYPCNAGIYNVSYGFYDLFGEGKVSEETTVVVKVLVDQKLLEDGAVSIKKVDETVTKAIEDASNNYKEDLSSVSADLSNTNEDLSKAKEDLSKTKENLNTVASDLSTKSKELSNDLSKAKEDLSKTKENLNTVASDLSTKSKELSNDLSKTKENLNTVASDLSTKSKELSEEITGVKQNVTGLTSTVNNNAGNISQLQQRATNIETTVADNNKKLSSQITQNANSISTVVANLNSTNLANSPYRSITQLKQTTDSISSTVSANKSAQDSVNSSLTSKINQNADSITSVVANLNNTDLANSPYKSITQLKQTTDSISSTVSANKSAQDNVNYSLTSKINQTAGSISSVVANLNNTDLANNPYKSITTLKQTTDSISSTVSANKNSTDGAISQVSQKADTIKATIEGNLNSTDTSRSPYKAITQLQANINGVSSVVSANKSATDSEISEIRQTTDSISSTVSSNKSAQDNVNSSLTSKIQQNAGSISSVVANLNNTNLANSPYKSITQLKQTTDSISSTVSANKSAQDNVNSSLTSKIQQNANSVTTVVANLNSTDLANSPYRSITQLKQTTDSISSTVSANKNSTDEAISQVSQKADSIKATIEGNLNSTDISNSPYKAITQLQANINGVSSTVSANKNSTDSEISQIKQTASSISSVVSANKSAQDSVNSSLTSKIQQNANSVTSIIANLSDVNKAKQNYSAISQLQDDINLRVVKGNVISQINLDKTGATIDGKLLHVTGDTVIEKNVIAKGMIQAGAVTTDNLAAETINLTDKLKIQGGAVTLDENGMTVKEANGSSVQFGENGMSFVDSNGHTFAGIGRFCTGIVNDGQTVKFANPWDITPTVFLFPIRLQTSAVGYTNINMYQDVEAINVTNEGFTAVCKSILKAGSGANIPLSWECRATTDVTNNPQTYSYNINVPNTATHIWITGKASAAKLNYDYNGESSVIYYTVTDYTSIIITTNTGQIKEYHNYVSGDEGNVVKAGGSSTYYSAVKNFTFDMALSNVSTVTVIFSIYKHEDNGGPMDPNFETSGGKLISYRTNLDSDVTICRGAAGFIAVDPNTVPYTIQ